MSLVKLSFEQKVFSQSMFWLEGLMEKNLLNHRGSETEILQFILGHQICVACHDCPVDGADKLIMSLLREFDEENSDLNLANCDPLLVLLVNSVLKSQNLSSLRLSKFAQDVSLVIQNEVSLTDEDNADLFPARFLLKKLGFNVSLKETFQLKERPLDFWVKADESMMHSIANEICASTVFGTKKPYCSEATLDMLKTAFSAWTLNSLYEYKLDLGAFLGRTLSYLDSVDSPTLNEVYQFILFQQQPDGRFGYLANEASKMKSKKDFNEKNDLYLPVTVSCLWTIAEMRNSKFRIFLM